MITSYIRVQEIDDGGVGYKSIPVQFPDDEDYNAIDLIDDNTLYGENEGDGISDLLGSLGLVARIQQGEYSPGPSVQAWMKALRYRIDFHNAHQQ